MAKSNHIKISVLVLALMLVCAGVILLGNTFANGVDYTKTPQTAVEADKNYNINLNSYNKQGLTANIIQNGVENASANFTEGMFWCPGRTEIIYLELKNNEAFPTSNTLSLNISDSTLKNVLSYAVNLGMKATDDLPDNWKAFLDKATTSGDFANGPYTLANQLHLAKDESVYIAVAIHMDENAGNAYQNQTMNLQFTLQTDANFTPGVTDLTNPQ